MDPYYLKTSHEYCAATGNGSGSERFYLHKMHIREAHGVLGRGPSAQLSEFMKIFIKSSFPNEDGASHAGFAEADACE